MATIYNPTNNVLVPQRNQRLVTSPDLFISAQDLMGVPGNTMIEGSDVVRTLGFSPSTSLGLAYQGLPGQALAGPGTIVSPSYFIYNKSGPYFLNFWPNSATLLAEGSQTPLAIWGSFDGSTNDPVVYPNGTSITNIENLFLVQVLPLSLPNGFVGQTYPTTTFSATGGQPPYVWSLGSGSPALPPGLTFTSGGTISGVPTQAGTFDFVIQLRDASGRVVDYNYAITINL